MKDGEEAERCSTISVTSGEIGSPVKRLSVRGKPNAHRPAPTAGHHLNGRHVDAIHVRPLLAVHFDRNVVLVQVAGDLLVLEGLLFHHMAPVASRITDGEKYRATEPLRGVERLVTPWIPVDGIVRVLEEVGARLEEESIGELRRAV